MLRPLAMLLVIAAMGRVSAAAAPPDPHGASAAVSSAAAEVQKVHDQIKALQAQCDADPAAWLPRYQLGEIFLRFGLASKALAPLEEAIRLKPDNLPSYRLAGEAYLQLKQYDKTIALWEKAKAASPNDPGPPAWIEGAKRVQREDARLAELNERLKKNVRDADALLERARLLAQRGNWTAAQSDLDLLLAIKPGDAAALGLAGQVSYRTGRLDEAIRQWEGAVKADPGDPDYAKWIEQAKRVKQVRADLMQVSAKLQEHPHDADLLYQSGQLWATLGNWPNAAEQLGSAAQIRPDHVATRKLYGEVLLRLGRMDEAAREIEACRKLDPKNDEYAKLLDQIQRLAKMHEAMKEQGPDAAAAGAGK